MRGTVANNVNKCRTRAGLALVAVLSTGVLLLAACSSGFTPAGGGGPSGQVSAPANQSPGVPAANAAKSRTQVSEGGSVTLELQWDGDTASTAAIRFSVAMNTHSVELGQFDLAKLATLRTDAGKEVKPTAWQAPSGDGHHVSGTLTFPAAVDGKPLIEPGTKYFEMIIRDVAGIKERVLRWTI